VLLSAHDLVSQEVVEMLMRAQIALLTSDLAERIVILLSDTSDLLLGVPRVRSLTVESPVEVLWSIFSRAVILYVGLSLALGTEKVLSLAHRAGLAATRPTVSGGLALLHVVDAAVGDALSLRKLLAAASHMAVLDTHSIKASKRVLSEAVASCLLLPLLSEHITHSVGSKVDHAS
jgi:hypothetical protein